MVDSPALPGMPGGDAPKGVWKGMCRRKCGRGCAEGCAEAICRRGCGRGCASERFVTHSAAHDYMIGGGRCGIAGVGGWDGLEKDCGCGCGFNNLERLPIFSRGHYG